MNVFLSYASEERALAERVCRVLETDGHDVFFDRDDLGGGDAFGRRIRTAIASADVLVYLISRSSVQARSYALTELAIVSELSKGRRPAILPVLTDDTPIDAVPPALRAYTILEPQGDAPAEIALAVDRIRTQHSQKRVRLAVVATVALLAAGGALWAITAWRTTPAAEEAKRPVEAPQPPRDPVEELNTAILNRTPPERRVTLTGMPGTDGWTGVLVLADRTATQVSYRLDGEAAFTSTGSTNITNPMTGAPLPNTTVRLPGAFWQRRTVAVKYTDMKGQEHGPYDVEFDPRSQFLQFTKQALGNVGWVTFQEQEPGKRLVYFTTLLSFKAALKEIRYSFDGDALDRTWPFTVRDGETWPARMDADQLFVPVPPSTRSVTVKIVYVDGSMDTRRFDAQS
jgi:hypothetical protein